MRNRIIAVLLLMCMFVQLAAYAETDATEYAEDFSACAVERMPNERWIVKKNSTDAVGAVMYRDTKVLKISKGAAGDEGNTGVKNYFTHALRGKVTVEAEVSAASANVNFAPMYLLDGEEKSLVCCTFNNKGQIGVYYNNQWNYSTEYAEGQWYTLRAEVDLDKHIFSFYVNGMQLASDVPTRSSGSEMTVMNTYITTVNTKAYLGSVHVSASGQGDAVELPAADEEKPVEYIDFSENVTVFEDDFESYALGEYPDGFGAWGVESETSGTTEIVSIGDNKAVMVSKGGRDAKGIQSLTYLTDTATAIALGKSIVTVEYRIRSGNTQKFIGGPYILSRTDTPGVTVGFGNAGFAYVNQQTSSIGAYEQEQWYDVKLVMDYPNKVFDVYVNGVPARVGEAFRSINSMDLKTIRFYTEASDGLFLLDDFRITTSNKDMPEPADGVSEVEKIITDGTANYIVTDKYVAERISVKPPVLLDTDGEAAEILLLKSDAVERLARCGQDLTVRAADLRITIPCKVFEGLAGRGDITIAYDKTPSNGALFSLKVRDGAGEIDRLADFITVKRSGCIDGEKSDGFGVIRTDSDGSAVNVVAKHDLVSGGVRFRTNRGGEFNAVISEREFNDISDGYWAKKYITAAAARGVVEGYTDGSFRAGQPVSRGEAAVMLVRAIGLDTEEYGGGFADVGADNPYAPYLAALLKKDAIDRGVIGGSFNSDGVISRADMACLTMGVYLKERGRCCDELTKFCVDGTLTDIDALGEKLADYVKAAYVMDFMNGENGRFDPDGTVTRAQAARIIMSMLVALGYEDGGLELRNVELTDLYTFPFTYKSYMEYIPNTKLSNMNENGAYGENAKYESGESSLWYMEEQRGIDDDIVSEIVRKRYLGLGAGEPELTAALMKAVWWGFSKQDETGGFDGSRDEYHSSAFFIEEAGRILLLMRESGDPSYNEYLQKYTDKLHKAALWMISDEEYKTYYNKGYFDIYTHRYFYYGAALLYAYRLTGDGQIRDKAHEILLEGISRMTKEGILPEKGGFDIGYGVTSIMCALRCLFVCDDPMIRSELRDLLVRSSEYIINKLDNQGNIDLSDSTRTGGQETKRDGAVKTVSERSFYNTLLAMAEVSKAGDFVKARDQMAVRQAYITPAFMEYKDSDYDLAKERINAPFAAQTGNAYLALTELPIKAYKVTQEYGNTGNPDAMFGDDDETEGWYARKLPQYVDMDLGMVREIGRIDTVFGDVDAKTYTYSIMVSEDGEDWRYCKTDIATRPITRNSVEFAYTKARYVRIWIQQIEPMYQAYWFTDIRGIKVYGVDSGEPLDFIPINSSYPPRIEY